MTHCPKPALHCASERGGDAEAHSQLASGASDEEEFEVRGPGPREGLFLMRSWGGNASLGRGGSLGQLPGAGSGSRTDRKRNSAWGLAIFRGLKELL